MKISNETKGHSKFPMASSHPGPPSLPHPRGFLGSFHKYSGKPKLENLESNKREAYINICVHSTFFLFFFVNERPLHMLLSTLPFFFFSSFILEIVQCHSYRFKCILFHWIPCYGYAALLSIRPSDKYGACFCSRPHFRNDCLCTSLSSHVFEYIWRLNPKCNWWIRR